MKIFRCQIKCKGKVIMAETLSLLALSEKNRKGFQVIDKERKI